MTTHTLKQCRPDQEETEYFWKLFHAAQRNDARWHGSEIEFIAEELSRTDLNRNQKLFLLRAWQVLIDDKGGFGRFMGAFDTYVYNMQDPNDECVAWKPELSKLLHDGVLLGVVLEAYDEALLCIAELSMESVALALTIEKCREITSCPAGVDLQEHLRQLAAENVGLKAGRKFFMYSDDAGFETYPTREEAIKAAEEMIDDYRGDTGDGWPEEAGTTRWGVIIQQATECDYEKPSAENGWQGSCDYRLLPETPTTDSIYAGVKAAIEYPKNNSSSKGWTIDPEFLSRVAERAGAFYGYHPGLEETEAALLAGLDLLGEVSK